MKYIITGGCGFVGINLALSFSKNVYKDILVIDNLSKKTAVKNLSLLKKAKISFKKIDIAKSPIDSSGRRLLLPNQSSICTKNA